MRYYNFDTATENELLKILDRDTPSDTAECEALKFLDTKQSREVSGACYQVIQNKKIAETLILWASANITKERETGIEAVNRFKTRIK